MIFTGIRRAEAKWIIPRRCLPLGSNIYMFHNNYGSLYNGKDRFLDDDF